METPKISNSNSKNEKVLEAVTADLEELLRPVWYGLLIEKEPAEIPALVSVENTPIVCAGEHLLIIGKKKTRKSLLVSYLLSLNPNALLFDTEQSRRHAWKVTDRVKRMTGVSVPIFSLRGKNPMERREIISETLAAWIPKPQIVYIDGIRDLLSDINSPEQATQVIVWIEELIKIHGIAICNVLHTNKVDNNARGHLGSELTNKAFCTIELSLHESGCTIVKCESSREEPFVDFAFQHNSDGLPEVIAMPSAVSTFTDEEKQSRLKFMCKECGPIFKYGVFVEEIKEHFEVGVTKAKALVKEFSRKGWTIKDGKEHTKAVTYKILI